MTSSRASRALGALRACVLCRARGASSCLRTPPRGALWGAAPADVEQPSRRRGLQPRLHSFTCLFS
eukprot:1738414-Prymnesium_polylepis.1